MDFFNAVKDKACEVANKTAKMSSEVVESTKLKFSIMEAESKISNYKEEIGELVYQAFDSGADNSAAVTEICEAIQQLRGQIEESREKINGIKKQVTCPECGKEFKREFSYCPHCGSANANQQFEESEEETTYVVTEFPKEENVDSETDDTPEKE